MEWKAYYLMLLEKHYQHILNIKQIYSISSSMRAFMHLMLDINLVNLHKDKN